VIREPVFARLVHARTFAYSGNQYQQSRNMVVAVSVTSPADPAVPDRIRVQLLVGVNEAVLGDERPVEVVFERDEK